MLTDAELAGMRATADEALPDTVTYTRPSTGGAVDPETGEFIPDPGTTIYNGPGRVRPASMEDIEVLFGDQETTKARFVGTVPSTAAPIFKDDVCVVAAGSDPHIGDRTFRVTSHQSGSWLINRRIALEAVE